MREDPELDNYQKMGATCNFRISGRIWISFFLNRSEFNPESKHLVIHKILFGIPSQIRKR